jgi:hypothetical protein
VKIHPNESNTQTSSLRSRRGISHDQLSTRANSGSPPNSVGFDAFHQVDPYKRPPPYIFGPDGIFQRKQEPFVQISSAQGPPVAAGPIPDFSRFYGHVNAPQSVMGGRYDLAPGGTPPTQSQVFFATHTQQNTRPATSSSNDTVFSCEYWCVHQLGVPSTF